MKWLVAIATFCLRFSNATAQPNAASPQQSPPRIIHSDGDNPTATVYTYGRRPLEEAILEINHEYGWGINYEDAPTVNANEVVDDDLEFRLLNPGYREGYSPNGQPFSSTFPESPTHHADKEVVLQRLLRDYNASTNPGRYSLVRTAKDGYVVVGVEYKSESGSEAKFTPLLNCEISLTISPMSIHDALQLVAKEVTDTCKTELNGENAGYVLGPLAGGFVSGTFKRELARNVIEELLSRERGLVWYSVEHMPSVNEFYLEAFLVRQWITGVDGNRILDPVLNGGVGDAESRPH